MRTGGAFSFNVFLIFRSQKEKETCVDDLELLIEAHREENELLREVMRGLSPVTGLQATSWERREFSGKWEALFDSVRMESTMARLRHFTDNLTKRLVLVLILMATWRRFMRLHIPGF